MSGSPLAQHFSGRSARMLVIAFFTHIYFYECSDAWLSTNTELILKSFSLSPCTKIRHRPATTLASVAFVFRRSSVCLPKCVQSCCWYLCTVIGPQEAVCCLRKNHGRVVPRQKLKALSLPMQRLRFHFWAGLRTRRCAKLGPHNLSPRLHTRWCRLLPCLVFRDDVTANIYLREVPS